MKKLLRGLMPLVFLALGLCALASGAAAGTDSPSRMHGDLASGTLRVALSSDTGQDPRFGYNDDGATVLWQIYDSFTKPGKNGIPAPELAVSWKKTNDRTWVVDFRKGVHFSDGTLFTSKDVLATIDSYKASGLLSFWIPYLVSWRALNAYRVQFNFNGPNSVLPANLEVMFAFPAKELQAGADLAKFTTSGTGPYIVKTHRPGSQWVFVRNPHYWGPKSGPAEVDVSVIPADSSREAALKSGVADVAIFQGQDAATALSGPNVKLHLQPSSGFWELDINGVSPLNPALKDARVRQAILYAIDKPSIIKLALGGLGRPTGAVGGGFPDGCTASTDPYEHANLAKARSLLQAAGASNLSLSLLDANPAGGGLGNPAIAQVIQQQLKAAGITVKLEEQDNGTWTTNVFTRASFDLAFGAHGGFGDATALLALVTPSHMGSQALWKFVASNASLSRAILAVKKLLPGSARKKAMQRVCQLVNSNASGTIGLITKPEYVAYRSDRLRSVSFPPIETVGQLLANLSRFQLR